MSSLFINILTAQAEPTFLTKINDLASAASGFLWDNILVYLLLGAGIGLTIYLGFPQITHIGKSIKQVFGEIFNKESGKSGVSSFQALATAVAAQVGTGNIGGVATAIMAGGPGAIFWMWISGLFGMSTIFSEAILAQLYRRKEGDQVYGGPSYYLSQGIGGSFGKFLAIVFSIFIIIALGFFGNLTQSNSIGVAMESSFGINPIITGVVVAALALMIFAGGIKRIAQFAELVVPFMAVIYIIVSIYVLIANASMLPTVFKSIFTSAFSTQAVAGGLIGATFKEAMRFGIARGLFSNEAGMGSTPHAHATAEVKHPVNQGLVAMFGVIVDTVLICSLTAIVILATNAPEVALEQGLKSVAITQQGFINALGSFGGKFLGIALLFFAFTTIIGWYYFGESNINYLFGQKALWPYRILVVVFIILGSFVHADLAWTLSDLFNGLMVIPNIIGVIWLSGKVKKTFKEFKNQK